MAERSDEPWQLGPFAEAHARVASTDVTGHWTEGAINIRYYSYYEQDGWDCSEFEPYIPQWLAEHEAAQVPTPGPIDDGPLA
jgi:hypothetical protein